MKLPKGVFQLSVRGIAGRIGSRNYMSYWNPIAFAMGRMTQTKLVSSRDTPLFIFESWVGPWRQTEIGIRTMI